MGHLNLKNSSPGLVLAVLIILSVSLPFPLGIFAAKGQYAPLVLNKSTDINGNGQNDNLSSGAQQWSSSSLVGANGNADILMTASIVAIVIMVIVLALATLMLLKGKKMMKGKGPLFHF